MHRKWKRGSLFLMCLNQIQLVMILSLVFEWICSNEIRIMVFEDISAMLWFHSSSHPKQFSQITHQINRVQRCLSTNLSRKGLLL